MKILYCENLHSTAIQKINMSLTITIIYRILGRHKKTVTKNLRPTTTTTMTTILNEDGCLPNCVHKNTRTNPFSTHPMSRVRLKPHHMCVRGKEWESQPDKQNRKKIQAYYRGGVGKNQQKAFVSIVFLDHTSTFIISHGGRALSFGFPSAGTPVSEQKSGLANQPKILCQATSTPVPLVPTIFVPPPKRRISREMSTKKAHPTLP